MLQAPAYQALSPTLALISQALAADAPVVVTRVVTNHIFCIDCSGSMYGELDKIRQQLKNKLPLLVKPDDTVSILWFSGKGQCGIIVEGLRITTAQGLADLQQAVDRYLQPIGLTGFKEPLENVQQVVTRVTSQSHISTHSLLFLTDGYDNQWSTPQLLEAVKPLGSSLASAVFVEYGYYCNRPLLIKLAEACGGRTIFSQDFADYQPQFEQFVTSKQSGKPKVKVSLATSPKYGVAFSYDTEGITVYALEADNQLLVDPELTQLFYLSEGAVGRPATPLDQPLLATYATLYVLSQRMKSEDVYTVLNHLGDVELLDTFTNAFGKQKLYHFQNMCLETVLGQRTPFAQGLRPSGYVVDKHAYCLLDLLRELAEDEHNRFIYEHPAFVYQRIGAKKVAVASREKQALQQELAEASEQYARLMAPTAKTKPTELDAANKRVAELSAQLLAMKGLRFVPTPAPGGIPFSDLVWNENRPNLSVRVFQQGQVDLSGVAGNTFGLGMFDTFQYRTYTLVKDGIVNVKVLPVSLSQATFESIVAKAPQVVKTITNRPAPYYSPGAVYLLDLTALPLINRSMVEQPSAADLFRLQYKLQLAQAEQTVFNYYQKQHFPKESKGYLKTYGPEATAWLKEQGFTEASGFAPRSTEEKVGETYQATELKVELVGMKSKPALKDVLAKIVTGKELTENQKIYDRGLLLYQEFTQAKFYLDAANQDILLSTWLLSKQEAVVAQVREYLNQLARIKFGVILGQVWFTEFESLEDTTLTLEVDGKQITGKALLDEVTIEI
jgi:hypothetical protein